MAEKKAKKKPRITHVVVERAVNGYVVHANNEEYSSEDFVAIKLGDLVSILKNLLEEGE